MRLTQKNFDLLVESFNHTTTEIKGDIKWLKKIGWYMAIVMTAQLGVIFI